MTTMGDEKPRRRGRPKQAVTFQVSCKLNPIDGKRVAAEAKENNRTISAQLHVLLCQAWGVKP